MAWMSFGLICLFAAAASFRLFVGDDPNPWTGIIGILMGVLGGIVISYTGFAAWEDVAKVKAEAKELQE